MLSRKKRKTNTNLLPNKLNIIILKLKDIFVVRTMDRLLLDATLMKAIASGKSLIGIVQVNVPLTLRIHIEI